MSLRPSMVVLMLMCGPAAARAQEAATHPAELSGVWVHPDSVPGTAAMHWSVIRFQPDGGYRAVRVEAPTPGENHPGEPVSGRWAALATDVKGPLLCTRPDGADQSRCNGYRVERAPASLLWKDVSFIPADTAMLRRLGVPAF